MVEDALDHDNDRLKQRSSDAPGDGDEVGLAFEDLYKRRVGELGEIDLSAIAEAAQGLLIGRDRRHLWQQSAGVNEESFERGNIPSESFQFVEGVCFFETKDARLGSAQAGEVSATLKVLAKIVDDGADVAASADGQIESYRITFHAGDDEAGDVNYFYFEVYRLAFPGQFIGRLAGNLFCGVRGRHLLDVATKSNGHGANAAEGDAGTIPGPAIGAVRRAFSIVGVGGETEAHCSGVALFGLPKVLRESRELAEDNRQNTGGHGIERAQMANGLFAGDAAHLRDHVVAGDACWFVDN